MNVHNNKSKNSILLLGGYGNAGRSLARLLLQHADDPSLCLILAGRHVDRAEAFAQELNREFPSNTKEVVRVTARQVDVSDPMSLQDAFSALQDNVRLVVVASSTTAYTQQVASAALRANMDYFDIQLSKTKVDTLKAMAPEITKANLCFITDGGFHPGLPAAMIRYVAPSFQTLEVANVGSVVQADWNDIEAEYSIETMEEFASEFTEFQTMLYQNGEWKDVGYKTIHMEFGETFGKRMCFPLMLEEMKNVPTQCPGISETGFYIAGLNWFVDWFVTPIVMIALKLWPQRAKRSMARLLHWGLRTFSKPPYGCLLKLEAKGVGPDPDGEPLSKTVTVFHQDQYALTAIPAAATLLQYLSEKDSIRKPGLWCQAIIADPKRLMVDMERMGLEIQPSPMK